MKEKIELNAEAISLRKEFGEDANSPINIFSLIHNNDDLTIVFYPMSDRVSGICIRDGKNKIIGVNSRIYGSKSCNGGIKPLGKTVKSIACFNGIPDSTSRTCRHKLTPVKLFCFSI